MRQMSGKFALVLAIGFGLTASLLVWAYLDNLRKQSEPPPTVAVVVAAVDIPARTTLNNDLLKTQQVPVDLQHPKAFTSVEDLAGKVTKLAITEGEQVLQSKVFADREESGLAFVIPNGKRAVSVGVTEIIGSGGLIVPGDKVDVVAVFDSRVVGTDMASIVLQDVEVLAVAQVIRGEETVSLSRSVGEQTGLLSSTSKDQPKTDPKVQPTAKSVTLAVSAEEAQRLILAEEKGKIRLALRAYGDTSKVNVPEAILTAARAGK